MVQPWLNQPFSQANQFFFDLLRGYKELVQNLALFILLICAQIPSMFVIMSAYLFPLYILEELKQQGSVFALGETLYSLGAIAAGFIMYKILMRINTRQAIIIMVGTMSLAVLMLTLWPSVYLYLGMLFVIGFGSAGSRIAQLTLIMEMLPHHLMGRIQSAVLFVITFLRIVIMASFIVCITYFDVLTALFLEGLILVVTLLVAIYCHVRLRKRGRYTYGYDANG